MKLGVLAEQGFFDLTDALAGFDRGGTGYCTDDGLLAGRLGGAERLLVGDGRLGGLHGVHYTGWACAQSAEADPGLPSPQVSVYVEVTAARAA